MRFQSKWVLQLRGKRQVGRSALTAALLIIFAGKRGSEILDHLRRVKYRSQTHRARSLKPLTRPNPSVFLQFHKHSYREPSKSQ